MINFCAEEKTNFLFDTGSKIINTGILFTKGAGTFLFNKIIDQAPEIGNVILNGGSVLLDGSVKLLKQSVNFTMEAFYEGLKEVDKEKYNNQKNDRFFIFAKKIILKNDKSVGYYLACKKKNYTEMFFQNAMDINKEQVFQHNDNNFYSAINQKIQINDLFFIKKKSNNKKHVFLIKEYEFKSNLKLESLCFSEKINQSSSNENLCIELVYQPIIDMLFCLCKEEWKKHIFSKELKHNEDKQDNQLYNINLKQEDALDNSFEDIAIDESPCEEMSFPLSSEEI
jgi:hypothetical protein